MQPQPLTPLQGLRRSLGMVIQAAPKELGAALLERRD
jgi:hypothetical protein